MYKRNEYFDNFIEPFLEIKKLYPELSERKSIHLSHFDKYLSKAMLYGNIYDNAEFNTTVISALKKYFKLYFKKFIRKPIDRVHLYQTHEEYNKFRSIEDLKFFTKDYFDEEWFIHMTNALYR
jgi:hypothetical protein